MYEYISQPVSFGILKSQCVTFEHDSLTWSKLLLASYLDIFCSLDAAAPSCPELLLSGDIW